MTKHRITLVATVLLTLTLLAGCATANKPTTLPPGAINSFDANSYIALMGVQAGLNSVKADYAAGKVPAQYKPQMNQAIAAYNTAQASWSAYHSGANGDTAALTRAISQATTAVVTLITAVSGGH
jgi:predicted lipoprotein